MTVEAARLYRFRAFHSLPGYPEPWCYPHGHLYTVELVGTFNHEQADQRWLEVRERYENADLNNQWSPTTVEVLAAEFLEVFKNSAGIRQCTVWEDDDRWGRATR